MSVVSSAKHHDLEDWTYLKNILDQLLAGTTGCEQLLAGAIGTVADVSDVRERRGSVSLYFVKKPRTIAN